MALVSLTDAARLVRKSRSTLARDIERGQLHQTVLQDGDARLDTAELLRAYGHLHRPDPEPRKPPRSAGERQKIVLLEQRVQALERVIALEAELRRTKDQVSNELRARLADKDRLIQTLESTVALLTQRPSDPPQQADIPTLDPAQRISAPADATPEISANSRPSQTRSQPVPPDVAPPASFNQPANAPSESTSSTTAGDRTSWWSRWFKRTERGTRSSSVSR